MKFIRKHTEGPFVWAGIHIFQQKDNFFEIAEVNERRGISKAHKNVLLFVQAPSMLDYLIERAELLSEQTQFNDSQFDDGWKSKKRELSRLLEIIKAAGVEVEI